MGRSVEVVVAELRAAADRLRDAGQRLQDGLSGVDLETRQLLGSGWKGEAAAAYGPAWDQWHNGAGQVVRGLQTMSELLSLAGKEYAKTDEQAGEVLDSTMRDGGGAGGPSGGAGGPSGAELSGPVSELAEQMNLDQPGQMGGGSAQAGQLPSGFLQQAGQLPSGFLQQAGQAAQQVSQMASSAAGDSAGHDDNVGSPDRGSETAQPQGDGPAGRAPAPPGLEHPRTQPDGRQR